MTEENHGQASCAVLHCFKGKVLLRETSAQEPFTGQGPALGIQPLM